MTGLAWAKHLRKLTRRSRRPHSTRNYNRRRIDLEKLEDRTTPSIITWTNRGVTSGPNDDYFNEVFGAQAGLARSVIDAAINEWSKVITNLNGAGVNNSLPVQISMGPDLWGQALFTDDTFSNGMPASASITIASGTDGHGAGWYLDPNLFSSAFTVPLPPGTGWVGWGGPFAGYAQAGSPAFDKGDLLEAVSHEMAHALGYAGSTKVLAHATNTNVISWKGGHYWAFVGSDGFHTLMDSLNGNSDLSYPYHAAPPGDPAFPISFGGLKYWGTDDVLTPTFRDSQRRLISRNDAYVLRDAYGYTVNDPATALGTFYAQLDETGKLWVRGRQDDASNDTITLGTHSSVIGGFTYDYVDVTVAQSNPVLGTQYSNPYTASFDASAVKSIEIDTGDVYTGAGTATVNIEQTYTEPITVNCVGAAIVNIGHPGSVAGTFESADIAAPITVNNKSSSSSFFVPTVNVEDSGDSAPRFVNVSQATLGGTTYGTLTGLTGNAIFYSNFGLDIQTGTGGNIINVVATGAPLTIDSGGMDTVTLGTDLNGGMQGISGGVTLHNASSFTDLTLDDFGDGSGRSVTVDQGEVSGLGNAQTAPKVDFDPAALNRLTIKGGTGSGNVFNVVGTYASTHLVNNGPSGVVKVGSAGTLQNILGELYVEGPGQGNSITVDDSADPASQTVTLSTFINDADSEGNTDKWGQISRTYAGLFAKPINYEYPDTSSVTIKGGAGSNVYDVEDTGAAATNLQTGDGTDTVNVLGTTSPLTINTGAGHDTVNVTHTDSSGKKTLQANVQVNGGGDTSLVIFDNNNPKSPVTVGPSGVTIGDPVTIGYSNVQVVTLYGPVSGAYDFEGTPPGTLLTVYLGAGPNDITIAPGASGSLSLVGGGTGALTIDDSAESDPAVYTITASTVQVNGAAAISYAGFQSLAINGGAGDDTFNITAGLAIPLFVNGGGGSNTLVGPNIPNTWNINAANGGTLDGKAIFLAVQNLIGGGATDVFQFQTGGSLAGTLDGGGDVNALDYSAYKGDITVDLPLHLASLIHQMAANSVSNIQNVTGSQGNDLLVGDANPNVLIGGTGRNVLIGGAGSDTVNAGPSSDDNILIGGTTAWDTNLAALEAIMAEWTRTDLNYADRFSDLTNGTNDPGVRPLNQVNGQLILLNRFTVFTDSSPDTLIGGATRNAAGKTTHDWFFVDAEDVITNLKKPGDHVTRI